VENRFTRPLATHSALRSRAWTRSRASRMASTRIFCGYSGAHWLAWNYAALTSTLVLTHVGVVSRTLCRNPYGNQASVWAHPDVRLTPHRRAAVSEQPGEALDAERYPPPLPTLQRYLPHRRGVISDTYHGGPAPADPRRGWAHPGKALGRLGGGSCLSPRHRTITMASRAGRPRPIAEQRSPVGEVKRQG
jgi:hypothetical protein